ncbi:hypothetical protein PPYR_09465 [Photinus pyralis]|uniref:Transcription termination factor 3, mitochondrial n=1 Tax=Photinus pyralis TaxID=7054 RepID=A0A1Y1MS45_PHOPY|nr:transcription termination factor 3, mitochondrial [Photinus pyralis]KAB0798472.1 hypothetical protein PPYR_09465 [Photinus pyralis]
MLLQRFRVFLNLRQLSSIRSQELQHSQEGNSAFKEPSELDLVENETPQRSVLDECTDDISHVAPYLKPTFNFAAYVNKSHTLQELVKLNVDLSVLEKKPEVVSFILKLEFEKDVKDLVIFLSEIGVDDVGAFITKNPFILKADLDNLHVRVNYLKSKRFTNGMIASIVTRNPIWLSTNTQDIDSKLGFFQKEFQLTGKEVRALAVQQPKLITFPLQRVKLNTFVFKEEMGLRDDEVKSMLLKKPNLFMKSQANLLKTFEFLHKKMNIPIERIVEVPEVLMCRLFRIRQRHLFLDSLGRAQYNHRNPNYVSLLQLVSGSDVDFSVDVAKSSVQDFNLFLKSL